MHRSFMKRNTLLIVLALLFMSCMHGYGQKPKKPPFNKENAYIWLNAKLALEPDDYGLDRNNETDARESTFSNCGYFTKIHHWKIKWPSPNTEMYNNTIQVDLSQLNPRSIRLQTYTDEHNNNFSFVVQTTNSAQVVRRKIYEEGALSESRTE